MNAWQFRNNFSIVIGPKKSFFNSVREIFVFWDTLFFLTWRDIKIKYKQALIGFGWIILQPLLMTFVFVLFVKFTNIRMHNGQLPYLHFVLSGIILWNLFATAFTQASNSLVNNAQLIKKIYFPRIFFPLSSFFVSFFDFFISLSILIIFMVFYSLKPSLLIFVYLPFAIILIFLFSIGLGSFFSAINVKYRDVKYIVPFFTQFLFFVTPVFYSSQLINSDLIRLIYYINPMSGIIELFRAGLFSLSIDPHALIMASIISIFVFLSGTTYFLKQERNFADVI